MATPQSSSATTGSSSISVNNLEQANHPSNTQSPSTYSTGGSGFILDSKSITPSSSMAHLGGGVGEFPPPTGGDATAAAGHHQVSVQQVDSSTGLVYKPGLTSYSADARVEQAQLGGFGGATRDYGSLTDLAQWDTPYPPPPMPTAGGHPQYNSMHRPPPIATGAQQLQPLQHDELDPSIGAIPRDQGFSPPPMARNMHLERLEPASPTAGAAAAGVGASTGHAQREQVWILSRGTDSVPASPLSPSPFPTLRQQGQQQHYPHWPTATASAMVAESSSAFSSLCPTPIPHQQQQFGGAVQPHQSAAPPAPPLESPLQPPPPLAPSMFQQAAPQAAFHHLSAEASPTAENAPANLGFQFPPPQH